MRLSILISILIWLLIIVGISHADMIGGVIINETTRQVMPGVSVEIRRCHCGSPSFSNPPIATVTTDAFGSYSFCAAPKAVYKVTPVPKVGQTVTPNVGFFNLMEPCK